MGCLLKLRVDAIITKRPDILRFCMTAIEAKGNDRPSQLKFMYYIGRLIIPSDKKHFVGL